MTFYASTDTTITPGDRSLGFKDFPSVGAGESRSESTAGIQLPGNLPDGAYYIGAIVSLADADSANNTNFDPVPITIRPPTVTAR